MTVLTTTDVANGAVTDATVMNNNFTSVKNVVNGNIDDDNISAAAAIDPAKIAGYPADNSKALLGDGTWGLISAPGGSGNIPAGGLIPYAGPTAPSGYLLCDGTAVSRTTYVDLFTAISTAYGIGDGSTTFNLPDLRGRVPVGKGTHVDVDTLNDSDGLTASARRPKHKHTVNDSGHTHPIQGSAGALLPGATGIQPPAVREADSDFATDSATTGVTVGPQTGSEPTDGPAFVVLNWIIKT